MTTKTFEAFYLSFYSKKFYKDVIQKWGGFGYKVLALLALVYTLVFTIFISFGVNEAMKSKELGDFTAQMPAITLNNGEVSIDKPSPHVITIDGQTFAVIDTSDATAVKTEGELIDEMKKQKQAVLLTRTRLLVNDEDKHEIKSYDLSENKNINLVIDKPFILEWAGKIFYIMLPIFMIMMFGGIFVYFMIQALIYAFFGILITKIMDTELNFEVLQRLAACALIPVTLGGFVLNYLIGLPLPLFLCFAITISYMIFGISAVKKKKKAGKSKK